MVFELSEFPFFKIDNNRRQNSRLTITYGVLRSERSNLTGLNPFRCGLELPCDELAAVGVGTL